MEGEKILGLRAHVNLEFFPSMSVPGLRS